MYPADDLPGAEERLQDFLVGRFGGPPDTRKRAATRGCGCATCRSSWISAARDRWVQLMDRALDQAALPADAARLLRDFFHHMSTFLMNTPMLVIRLKPDTTGCHVSAGDTTVDPEASGRKPP